MKHTIKDYKNLPVQVKATVAFFICSILQKGISVISTPIFTRILSAENYGQFGSFSSWYEIANAIISLGLVGGVYTSLLVKNENERSVIASSTQGLLFVSVGFSFVIYFMFADKWNVLLSLNTIQVVSMLLLVFTSSAFRLWSLEQRVTYNYKTLVAITLVTSVAKPILGIILVLHASDKVTARILSLLIVELTCYLGIIIKQYLRGKVFCSIKYWLYNLRICIPLIPHALSQTVLNSSDRIMINSLIGERETGFYTLAYSVALIMIIVNTSLSQTLAPWTYQKLKDNKENEINRIAITSCIAVATINLLLILIAPELISIFAPQSYSGAIYVIPPVAMSVYLMHLYDWFARIEYYHEKTQYVLIASISGAVINILLNYIFIPRFGYVAAGYTTLASYGVYAGLHFIFMQKICKDNGNKQIYNGKQLLVLTACFIFSGICLNFTYSNSIVRYIILLAFIMVMFLFRGKIIKVFMSFMNRRKT